jgi:hypothetical protein
MVIKKLNQDLFNLDENLYFIKTPKSIQIKPDQTTLNYINNNTRIPTYWDPDVGHYIKLYGRLWQLKPDELITIECKQTYYSYTIKNKTYAGFKLTRCF